MAQGNPKSEDLAKIGTEAIWTSANHYAISLYYTYSKCHDILQSLHESDAVDQVFLDVKTNIVNKLKFIFLELKRGHFPLQIQHSPDDNECARQYFNVRRTEECCGGRNIWLINHQVMAESFDKCSKCIPNQPGNPATTELLEKAWYNFDLLNSVWRLHADEDKNRILTHDGSSRPMTYAEILRKLEKHGTPAVDVSLIRCHEQMKRLTRLVSA